MRCSVLIMSRVQAKGDDRLAIASVYKAMPPTILLVEDDAALIELLTYNFQAAGFIVVAVQDGHAAVQVVREHKPVLIVLDWMLPGVSGLEITQAVRADATIAHIPILMLTARGLSKDKLMAFEAGVDDYVVKPFSIVELIARMNGLIRRSSGGADTALLAAGDLTIDPVAHRVLYKGVEIDLGPTEFKLLEYLVECLNRTLTRSQLITRVWGHDALGVNDRTVDVHIGNLRRALMHAGVPNVIRTVRGTGYMIVRDGD